MKSVVVTFLAFVAGVQGADLEFSNVSHLVTTVIAFGVATTDGNDMYVPASDGGSVGYIQSHDSGATTTYTVDPLAAILMAAGASAQTIVLGGLWGVGLSKDFGSTFTQIMPDISKVLITQDVKYESSSGLFGIAGDINGVGAVAVSADEGLTWTTHSIETEPPLINSQDIRYAAYPTQDTWYATAGFWGDGASDVDEKNGDMRLTRRIIVGADGHLQVSELPPVEPSSTYSGAWGSVVKTTDGGETWSVVYNDTTSGLYPNDIHCSDANTCAFALDITDPSQGAQIMSTTNGGANWTKTTLPEGSSILGVRMVGGESSKETWVCGGDTTGKLWHSTDLSNWDEYATDPTDAAYLFSFALTPDGSSSYATGVLRSQLCSILKLDF